MAETITSTTTKRYAVVTGANKGIGLEICRQLASHGVTVVLTSRDEKRGNEACENLKGSGGLSDDHVVIFHKLDVVDPTSVSSLADFIKTKFGKLDILVNNAGVTGAIIEGGTLKATKKDGDVLETNVKNQTYEAAQQCLETNYYGAKRMAEALIPLLQLSDSPRIVNVTSSMGQLKNIPSEWAKGVLGDPQSLTEERVDEVLNRFLKDLKEGSIESEGWPSFLPAYIISKAALSAYTRVLAKKYPNFVVNCVCPGFVKTDMNFHRGILSVEEGAKSPVKLALLPNGSPSGEFFVQSEVSVF